MKKYAVIVAGGSGTRMNSEVPKQFLTVATRPILMSTIENFFLADPATEIILVLPKNEISRWYDLCELHRFDIDHLVVVGGTTRFQSVKNGLDEVREFPAVVAVHDGVRMFAGKTLINRCFEVAKENKSAIPVMPLKESIRKKIEEGTVAVDRSSYVSVQTPQCFDVEMLKLAYQVEEQAIFTDDAAVWEQAGHRIITTEGDEKNIKITSPIDLLIACQLYEESKNDQE